MVKHCMLQLDSTHDNKQDPWYGDAAWLAVTSFCVRGPELIGFVDDGQSIIIVAATQTAFVLVSYDRIESLMTPSNIY